MIVVWDLIFAICDTNDQSEEYEGAWIEIELSKLPYGIRSRVCGNTVAISVGEYIELKVCRPKPRGRRVRKPLVNVIRTFDNRGDGFLPSKKRRFDAGATADLGLNIVKRVRQTIDDEVDKARRRFFPDGQVSRGTLKASIEEKKRDDTAVRGEARFGSVGIGSKC